MPSFEVVTYAVIFTAEIARMDADYTRTAQRLRQLAIDNYGCLEFTSCTEGDRELAISYWPDEDHIRAWKQDPEHQAAQQAGRQRWYRSWSVQVAEVTRGYQGASST